MHRMYFDTETTGVFNGWQRDFVNYKRFPAIQSYAHMLVDNDWNVIEEYEAFVQLPDDVAIHPKALEVHGITRELCNEKGVPLFVVMSAYQKALQQSRMVLGFNVEFDLGMMEISHFRCKAEGLHNGIELVELPQVVDLMRYAKPICGLPPTPKMLAAGMHDFKPPKLTEALKVICDYDHVGAHGALADVKGCVMLHRKLVEIREAANAAS